MAEGGALLGIYLLTFIIVAFFLWTYQYSFDGACVEGTAAQGEKKMK
jgi:hypothetical protein